MRYGIGFDWFKLRYSRKLFADMVLDGEVFASLASTECSSWGRKGMYKLLIEPTSTLLTQRRILSPMP